MVSVVLDGTNPNGTAILSGGTVNNSGAFSSKGSVSDKRNLIQASAVPVGEYTVRVQDGKGLTATSYLNVVVSTPAPK